MGKRVRIRNLVFIMGLVFATDRLLSRESYRVVRGPKAKDSLCKRATKAAQSRLKADCNMPRGGGSLMIKTLHKGVDQKVSFARNSTVNITSSLLNQI